MLGPNFESTCLCSPMYPFPCKGVQWNKGDFQQNRVNFSSFLRSQTIAVYTNSHVQCYIFKLSSQFDPRQFVSRCNCMARTKLNPNSSSQAVLAKCRSYHPRIIFSCQVHCTCKVFSRHLFSYPHLTEIQQYLKLGTFTEQKQNK